uniref:Tr-type G domain-containing protein n=1 Tax=Ciona savignyi TaxID=51511 RepID=H2YEZ3_CIOSA
MARHRNIRNNKSYDYDDDYDVYGQSYEDDYGVSPGTIAQYSYSRSSGKDVNISSYMPSEDTVEEEVWEDDLCFESSAAAQRHRSSGSVDTSSLNPIMLDACLDHIRDAVGENYSENQMRQASAKFNCNYEKAIDFLLNSSGQPSNSKNTTSRLPDKAKNKDCATATPHRTLGSNQRNTAVAEYAKREKEEKKQISLVVIGHVDAGKSTMMGHLLYQQGVVSKRLIHKYEQESKKIGKTSFAYAWVLDETGEERSRGVTMDVAHNRFETEHRIVTLMDAPGHRDFIPNMITGASEADVAVLVIGASTGEFEAGFGIGGQTREHALLVRSLGVSQLAVAVNKLDTLNWCQKRFKEILEKMRQFLKQAGFKESDVTYVPVSGLLGENLTAKATASELTSWYKGPSLIEVIDKFRAPQRPIAFPFRFCVNDVFRGQGSGITMSGKIESGGICHGTKVVVMPAAERGLIKSVDSNDGQSNSEFVLAGEHATLTLHGVDIMKVTTGSVLCDIDNPIRAVTRIQARIIVFSIEVPITRGFPVELHYKSVHEPAIIRRIISQLHRSTGEVVTKKPKFISKGHNALVEVELTRPVCLEEYSSLKELGRFTLRYGGSTIAACVVTKLLQ